MGKDEASIIKMMDAFLYKNNWKCDMSRENLWNAFMRNNYTKGGDAKLIKIIFKRR